MSLSRDCHNNSPRGGNRRWSVTSAPATEPITVEELKLFARIDGSTEDDLLEGFISGVREAAELYLGRALITQTMKMYLDYWPGEEIELPRPPLISVTSVKLLDEDGAETDYDSDNYYVITEAIPGRLVIKSGSTLPLNTDRYKGGYIIEFQAGYGGAASVPSQIKQALKLWATAVYETRAMTQEPPPQAKALLNIYRVSQY